MRSWISSHPAVHEATSAWVSSCPLPCCSMTGLLSAFPVMEPHHTTNRNCKIRGCLERGSGGPGRQASEHQAAHDSIYHGRARLREVLIVLAHPAIAPEPRKRPLHDPAPLQELEAGRFLGRLLAREDPDLADAGPPVLDHVDAPVEGGPHPGHETAPVADVDPQVTQPGEARPVWLERLQQQSAAVAVGDVRRVDQRLEHEALGVDQQVALAALHLLAPIVADGWRLSRWPPLSVVFTD